MEAQRSKRSRGTETTNLVRGRTKPRTVTEVKPGTKNRKLNQAIAKASRSAARTRSKDTSKLANQASRDRLDRAIGSQPHDTVKAMHRAETHNLWQEVRDEFELLDVDQLAARLVPGDSRTGRTAIRMSHHKGELVGVSFDGRTYFPGFEIAEGSPRPVIGRLNKVRKESNSTEPSLLLWLVSPTTWWSEDGDRPVDHLENEDEVLAAYEASMVIPW